MKKFIEKYKLHLSIISIMAIIDLVALFTPIPNSAFSIGGIIALIIIVINDK